MNKKILNLLHSRRVAKRTVRVRQACAKACGCNHSDKSLVCIVSDIGCRICFLGFCFVEFDNEDVVDMVMQKQYHDLAQGIKVSGNYYAQDGMYILVK